MFRPSTCWMILAAELLLLHPSLEAHPGHGSSRKSVLRASSYQTSGATSGQGSMRFRVLYASEKLPPRARDVLGDAHGGFAVDRRPGRGEVYFALAGAGLIQISADLGSIRLLETSPEMRDANLHNTTFWQASDGQVFLSLPANDAGRVFTTTLTGELVHILGAPTRETRFRSDAVNGYFRAGQPFTPTDVEHFRGRLYVTTGYSELDWVLTAELRATTPLDIEWGELAFGGRGTEPGLFGTGHGITVAESGNGDARLDVSDRPHAEIDRFTTEGSFLSTLQLPEGAFPCDIDYLDGYAVVGALYGPDRNKGAPIYVLRDDELVSELWPKDELGLEGFQHVHNAVFHRVDGRFYIIAQAWNPGDFAVLEQVLD